MSCAPKDFASPMLIDALGLPTRPQTMRGPLIESQSLRQTPVHYDPHGEPGAAVLRRQLGGDSRHPERSMGLAGVLAWPGRYLFKLGRVLPITVKPNPEGGSWYLMEPDVAELFEKARDAT
jgi:hypothetical protein